MIGPDDLTDEDYDGEYDFDPYDWQQFAEPDEDDDDEEDEYE